MLCVVTCLSLLQFDDVWVPEELEVLYLPFDFPHDIQAADLLPVEDLHRHFVAGQLMLAN